MEIIGNIRKNQFLLHIVELVESRTLLCDFYQKNCVSSPAKSPSLRSCSDDLTCLVKMTKKVLPIEMPKLTPGSLWTFTTLFGPHTLAGSELLDGVEDVP